MWAEVLQPFKWLGSGLDDWEPIPASGRGFLLCHFHSCLWTPSASCSLDVGRLFHELQWLVHKAGHLPSLVPKSKIPLFSFHFLHFSWILHWNFLHFGPICKYLFSLHTELILDSNVSSAFNTLLASWILLEIVVQTVKPVNIFSCFSVPF